MGAGSGDEPAWYERAETNPSGEAGLRFECTMCGNCCTGPPGYVLFTAQEASAIARRLGLTVGAFMEKYTQPTPAGVSLGEVETEHGFDCVFLDRESAPGQAVCGIYEARPEQCRTWPFWAENVKSPETWKRAGRTCPGIGRGDVVGPEVVRLTVLGKSG